MEVHVKDSVKVGISTAYMTLQLKIWFYIFISLHRPKCFNLQITDNLMQQLCVYINYFFD